MQPPQPETVAPGGPHSRFAPVRYSTFRHVVGARAVNAAGDWMQIVAAGWLMFELTGSAGAVGALAIGSRGPGVVASAYGGVLADRYDQRRLALAAAMVQLVAAAGLAAGAAFGELSVIVLYAATLVIGVGSALLNPLTQGMVPRSVPPEMIAPANSINVASYNLARMIGPVAGGGLVAAVGVEASFGLNAASFLAVVAMLAIVPRELTRAKHASGGVRMAIAAWRVHPFLSLIFISVATFALLIMPMQELAPVIAHEYGEGAHLVGFLLGALALGSVVGSLGIDRIRQRGRVQQYVVIASGGLAGIAVLALALAPIIVLALLAMAFVGAFWQAFFVVALTGVEAESPPELAGRELGLFFALTLGGLALGAPLIGLLLDLVGVQLGLIVVGGSMVAFTAWRAVRLQRLLHLVATPQPEAGDPG